MIPISQSHIDRIVKDLTPPDEQARTQARAHLDTLTKPLGSLGRLEDIAAQLIAIHGAAPSLPLRKAVYTFAADHGIADEGVSAYPRAVTRQMVLNFLHGGAAINVLARLHGVALHVVDAGVDADFGGIPNLIHRKVRNGSRNMLHEPAMSDEELAKAIAVGAELAQQASAAGMQLIAIGEMGIGNTTSASAITCALTGASAAKATGRGTGVDHAAHAHKIHIVERVVTKHCPENTPPLAILQRVGGLEIAAMTGMVLAAATHRITIVCDGFISTAAAALAAAIAPEVKGYLIAGHRSEEPGHALLLSYLDLMPVLTLNMRLGEGTGAVLAMPVIESALALYSRMATFASANISEASQ
ncbi:nicotinate-nucleotide-dimethylbenzimidazole phosphoribosyltransferase [Granulicella rosea]|uniref:Nicotinate-nucleotide--dimethylbenzimidazole phosphoribosyltransferase n=1 Tax=Granulicella rosea TaxID=474952 RepID=A0A239IQ39_9BACT|nr:nicotinate-nucleotide--dimethylbenzimidazole phosphoribosyltransferase [Granulicella rosea]SNS94544.1 nicotinate-nucleotide-dimethylbenzimidazole phosphoribosyltransferase [Granulicella rosea]